MKIYDVNGNERDWYWLDENYGPIGTRQPDISGGYYKIVELREKYDDSTFIVQVRDSDGNPQPDVNVVFYWDTAAMLPGAGWLEQGVVGMTNQNGDVGFGMGTGAYYFPPEWGPHKTWLYADMGGEDISEMLEGVGMLGGTNHYHMNAVYQWVEDGEPPPPPPPEPTDLSKIAELLEQQNAQLERIADGLGAFLSWWFRP